TLLPSLRHAFLHKRHPIPAHTYEKEGNCEINNTLQMSNEWRPSPPEARTIRGTGVIHAMKKLIIALALLPATLMLVLANSAHAAEKFPKLLLGLWCSTSTPSSTYEKNGKCSKEEGNDSWFELSPDGYEDYVNSCKTVSITVSIVERRGLVPVYSLVYNCGGS